MTLIERLDHVDKAIFTFIQEHLTTPWLDSLMLWVRNPVIWIPLYAFMVYWVFQRGNSNALKFIVLSVACIAITDFTSSSVLKPFFERLRPCYDPETSGIIRGLIGCGGKFSFPSSHAANHFGLAIFWFNSIQLLVKQKWYWLWFWAFLISFAQIYIGKHFPFDIVAGALLGMAIGWLLSKLFQLWTRPRVKKPLGNPYFSLP